MKANNIDLPTNFSYIQDLYDEIRELRAIINEYKRRQEKMSHYDYLDVTNPQGDPMSVAQMVNELIEERCYRASHSEMVKTYWDSIKEQYKGKTDQQIEAEYASLTGA
jgi:hypothetical protein